MINVQWAANHLRQTPTHNRHIPHFSGAHIKQAENFHASMPGYQPTPLYDLTHLAAKIGAGHIYVKDESQRFGLNAFKGLGVSYAMACYFADKSGIPIAAADFRDLTAQARAAAPVTFVTATDGNHGKGVAWAAQLFGQKAVVYLPKGSAAERLTAVRKLGAEALMTDLNYDDTVQLAAQKAQENNWILLQDTAWAGYQEVPLQIMQGYTTIIAELLNQLSDASSAHITHVFLQAGVGSFAGAMAAAVTACSSGPMPKIIIAEPAAAACLYQSNLDENGEPQRVYGDLDTIMAGLACGEPNPFAWQILQGAADYFLSCDDQITRSGMRLLGKPGHDDPRIISGESGAVTTGVVYELFTNPDLAELKDALSLNASANILVINTEGDTDPINYQKIINS